LISVDNLLHAVVNAALLFLGIIAGTNDLVDYGKKPDKHGTDDTKHPSAQIYSCPISQSAQEKFSLSGALAKLADMDDRTSSLHNWDMDALAFARCTL
jgi:hypothetical protein